MCLVHPLRGAMSIALYTVPTIYVHDTRGADPQKYATVTGVIQGCNFGINSFFLKDARPARWGPPDGWEPPGARSRKVDSLKKKWHELLSKCLSFFRLFFLLGRGTMEREKEHKFGLLWIMHFLIEEEQ